MRKKQCSNFYLQRAQQESKAAHFLYEEKYVEFLDKKITAKDLVYFMNMIDTIDQKLLKEERREREAKVASIREYPNSDENRAIDASRVCALEALEYLMGS